VKTPAIEQVHQSESEADSTGDEQVSVTPPDSEPYGEPTGTTIRLANRAVKALEEILGNRWQQIAAYHPETSRCTRWSSRTNSALWWSSLAASCDTCPVPR
jgi:hypothetical protein